MMSIGWSLVETTAQLLEGDRREAVLGDLLEAGESAWRALLGVLSLVLRLNLAEWKSWRPWLAAFGVSLPASLLLMGLSLSVSRGAQRFFSPALEATVFGNVLPLLLCQALLLVGCSWSAGFVAGRLSRRTIWISAVLCCSPCLFCLARFHVPSQSRFCLLLFLLPAIWGVCKGLRGMRIRLGSMIVFTLTLMLLMAALWNSGGQPWWTPRVWVLDAILIWPACYLVAMAWRENHSKWQWKQRKVAI
jgi:hypothetical protein